jgi:hypothetical protein
MDVAVLRRRCGDNEETWVRKGYKHRVKLHLPDNKPNIREHHVSVGFSVAPEYYHVAMVIFGGDRQKSFSLRWEKTGAHSLPAWLAPILEGRVSKFLVGGSGSHEERLRSPPKNI